MATEVAGPALGLVMLLLLVAGLNRTAAAESVAADAPRDIAIESSPQSTAHRSIVDLSDANVAIFAAAGIAILGHDDLRIAQNAPRANSAFAKGLGKVGNRFGNPLYSAPLICAAYLAGRMDHRAGLSKSALRIAGGMAAAAAVAGGMKFMVGRFRPYQSADDPARFDPLSLHTSFPSGHTTIAFSLAAGLDRETRAGWVPFVVYPAAAVAAWSRLRDHTHWASDVLAGAIVGTWASGRLDRLAKRRESRIGVAIRPMQTPSSAPFGLGAEVRF